MEKPSIKDMQADVMHHLAVNYDATYTTNELLEELGYHDSWKPSLAKAVSLLKTDGSIHAQKREGETVFEFQLAGQSNTDANQPQKTDQAQPEPIRLAELTHEYHLSKADKEGELILLHVGVGTLQSAINMAETLARQEGCDIIIDRIETFMVGKVIMQPKFQRL